MRSFDYSRADTPDAAVAAAGSAATKFIAGGTNLLDLMKLEIETPEKLVDISRLALRDVTETAAGGLSIGALVPNSDLAADERVRKGYPEPCRARCWPVPRGSSATRRRRAAISCSAPAAIISMTPPRPATSASRAPAAPPSAATPAAMRCSAQSSHCIATHPSDMAVALRALDATIVTLKSGGATRRIAVADFYRLPGDTPHIETVLEPGELITHIELPPPPKGRQTYRKVRDRASYAFALVSVAGVLSVEGGKIASAALAFGGLAPQPWRDAKAEAALIGKAPTPATFAAAADILLAGAKGFGANDFKIPLARRTLIGTLRELTASGDAA